MYRRDENTQHVLRKSMESVHPSVRIRLFYNGWGLDDLSPWACPALIRNKYRPQRRQGPNLKRPSQESTATTPHRTLLGDLIPYYESSDQHTTNATGSYVRTHHPHISLLEELSEQQGGYWVWQTADGQHELLEDHVGLWERMFMRLNKESLQRQQSNQEDTAQVTRFKDSLVGKITNFVASSTAVLNDARPNAMIERVNFPPAYRFHDIIAWLEADRTTNPFRVVNPH
jgi:hypothetical protein